jgi:hypothetical protein
MDITYDKPDVANEDQLVEHAISTLAQDSGVLRTQHGDRLVVLSAAEASPRSKSHLAVRCSDRGQSGTRRGQNRDLRKVRAVAHVEYVQTAFHRRRPRSTPAPCATASRRSSSSAVIPQRGHADPEAATTANANVTPVHTIGGFVGSRLGALYGCSPRARGQTLCWSDGMGAAVSSVPGAPSDNPGRVRSAAIPQSVNLTQESGEAPWKVLDEQLAEISSTPTSDAA